MRRNIPPTILVIITGLISVVSMAQEKDKKTIATEKVVIVKPYTPEISDAFKIKSVPNPNDSIVKKKKPLQYSIFSVPVASTFTPAKGKAAELDKPKKERIFDNFGTLGFGNYTTAYAQFYTNLQLNRSDNLGIYLQHNSSQGGIDTIALNNAFYKTLLDANYTSITRDYTYGIEAGLEHQLFNWYGLPETLVLTPTELERIDVTQQYFGARLTGKLFSDDSYFRKGSMQYQLFGDTRNSLEHHAVIQPTLSFEVGEEQITTLITADYLSGSFKRGINNTLLNPINYGFLNISVSPSVTIQRENLILNLGAAVFYNMNTEQDDNQLYVYPNVKASFRLLEETVIVFAGLEGSLKQNTYKNAVKVNPFVAPSLVISPTHNPYNGYLGFKGKLSDIISYNLKASYAAENNKPLFVSNRASSQQLDGFDYGNSFTYRYDDLKTVEMYTELNVNLSKKLTSGTTISYYAYTTTNQAEAWNLPSVQGSLWLEYLIADQWSVGTQCYFTGERKDIDTTISNTPGTQESIHTLDSFIDANIHVGYRFNKQLSFFVKGNNLVGGNYEQWINYPVQGLQVMAGATYKFDY